MKKTAIFAANRHMDVAEESSSLSPGTKKSANKRQNHYIPPLKSTPGVKPGVDLKAKNYRKRFMIGDKPYKLPTICRCKSGEWYIQYFYEWPDKPGKFKPIKIKDGINRIHDPIAKEAYAQKMVNDITYYLEVEGYNPFDEKKKIIAEGLAEIKNGTIKKGWTLSYAITHFRKYIEDHGYAGTTITAYKKYIKAFELWLGKNEYLDHVISDFTEMEVMIFLNESFEEKDWSARTFNNYLEFMITFFTLIRGQERTETRNRELRYNFYPEGLKSKNTTPQRNKSFTPIMLHTLKEKLRATGYSDLKDYLEWIFLSLMRPAEIRELRVGNIDDVSRQIRIIGKTGDRLIPISDQLMRIISRRKVLSNGINAYVFGYAGQVDDRRMSVDYFLDKFTTIKKEMGLDENYGPYSMKPTGVISMIKAEFKDEDIMVLTGHKTKDAFNTYKRDLVIENSHVMKGSTIEF